MNGIVYSSLGVMMAAVLLTACGREDRPSAEKEGVETVLPAEVNEVSVMTLKKGDFNHELVSNGKVEARAYADLNFRLTSEPVARVYVKNGDRVKKGQKLAELSLFTLQNKLEQAKTSLDQADLEMQDVLIGQGYAPDHPEAVPENVMKLARVRSGYEQSRANYELARYELQQAVLTAPFDGVVANLFGKQYNRPDGAEPFCRIIATAGMERVIGLTGTPAPNGLVDLWAQMYCIDQGERLGKSVTRYRETYFSQHKWNNITVRCELRPGCEEVIRKRIADICLSMQAKDYLQLPDLIVCDEKVTLGTRAMDGYLKFEREKVMEFQTAHGDEPVHVLAASAAGLMNKLSQYANGAIYDEDRQVHEIHDEKLVRLAELVEAANSSGSGVLVFYQYQHDVPRITAYLKGKRVRKYQGEDDLNAWNAGEVDVLLAHPASTAYGLNMQRGGHYIVWMGMGWNLELYQQANARLHRQGQTHPVIVYRLMCEGTVDERASAALEGKKSVQQGLLDGLGALIRKYQAR